MTRRPSRALARAASDTQSIQTFAERMEKTLEASVSTLLSANVGTEDKRPFRAVPDIDPVIEQLTAIIHSSFGNELSEQQGRASITTVWAAGMTRRR